MTAFLPVINHLIQQNRETQAALAAFAGSTLSLRMAGLHMQGTFDERGFLQHGNAEADTEISFRQTAVQKVLQGLTPGVGDVEIGGDTGLGTALLPLIGSLRYHAHDDLSRLFGDALAGSISTRTAQAGNLLKKMGLSVLEQLGEFAREPESPVPDRETLAAWSREVDALRDDTERLAARLERLENRQKSAE